MESRSPLERRVAWALFGLLVAGAVASMALSSGGPDAVEPRESSPVETAATPEVTASSEGSTVTAETDDGPPSFTIAATGDLLIHESVANAARTSDGWDFTSMFNSVAPILRQADLAVCHVESPMSPNNARLSYYPAFLVPRELADAISHAGYDTCSLASNHSTDAGSEGIVGTIGALDRVQVAHAGMALSPEARDEVTLINVGDATVAHLSYTYGFNNGELAADESYLSNVIDEAAILDEAGRARSAGADFVMLSMHWGSNYTSQPDEQQIDLGSRLLGSDDIDLIIGHHAHMVQPVVQIGGEFLVYGLGNFLSKPVARDLRRVPVAHRGRRDRSSHGDRGRGHRTVDGHRDCPHPHLGGSLKLRDRRCAARYQSRSRSTPGLRSKNGRRPRAPGNSSTAALEIDGCRIDRVSFKVGDRVVYPHHGAAEIVKLEKRTTFGEEQDYLVLRMTHGEMTVAVPADRAEDVGMRWPISTEDVDDLFEVLARRDVREPANWSRRYKNHQEKLKSGDVYQVAEVVRNLALRERAKGLSAGEKTLYNTARSVLVSELSFALNVSEDEASRRVDVALT